MSKFILHTTLLLAPVIALLFVIEISYSAVPNEYSIKSELLRSSTDSLEVIILGPSGTLRGINPEYIEFQSYNASLRGVDLEIDEAIIRMILEHQTKLKHIVLSVTFNDFHQNAKSLKAPAMVYFHKYFDFDGLYTFIGQERGVELLRKIWLYYVKGKVVDTGIQSNGYRIFKKKNKSSFELKAKKIAGSMSRPHPEFVDFNTSKVNEIVKLCQSHGISLSLISLPMHESFKAFVNAKQLQLVDAICEEISTKNEHVEYINWLDHSMFSDNHFQDPIHLNTSGAELLSKLLNSHLTANTTIIQR